MYKWSTRRGEIMDKTKKNFKLTLDNWYNGTRYRNKIYHQYKRGYGSYLYTQDKVKFNILFNLWEINDTKIEFENKT